MRSSPGRITQVRNARASEEVEEVRGNPVLVVYV